MPAAWVGTWATSLTGVPSSDVVTFEDQTIRQIARVSIGGDTLRVRLSNEFGRRPLIIGAAYAACGGTGRRLTFGGRSEVAVPPGAPALSDPVDLRVPPRSDVTVRLYLPERTEGGTVHASAFQRNLVANGNVAAATRIDPSSVIEQWYFLSEISVRAGRSVVALGDSITEGAITTVGANRRWPDMLAGRLQAAPGLEGLGVLNAGIGGNRLLHDPDPPGGEAAIFGESALRRFDRDVAARPGVRYVIVLLGVNDLGHPGTFAPSSEEVSAADIIGGYRQLIARAHERGLKIFGGTIPPFGGAAFGFHTPRREAERQTVNRWLRTGGEYDAVIDFDAALRDPARPGHLLPAYDSGDHLHPNDAGAAALAAAVPLQIFQ